MHGKSHLRESYPLFTQATPDPVQRREIDAMIADPNAQFVDHMPDLEVFRAVGAHLEAIARSDRYEKIPIRTVADRNGRAIFQVFRFQQMPAGPPKATASGSALPLP